MTTCLKSDNWNWNQTKSMYRKIGVKKIKIWRKKKTNNNQQTKIQEGKNQKKQQQIIISTCSAWFNCIGTHTHSVNSLSISLPIPWWTFTNMHFGREDTNLIVEISEIREAASTVPKASVWFSYRWTLQ